MPTTIEALIVVALVLSPGYVLATVASAVIAFERRSSDLRFLLPTVTCGTAVHIVMAPWTRTIVNYYQSDRLDDHIFQVMFWGLSLVFAVPVGLGVIFGRLSNVDWVDDLPDSQGLWISHDVMSHVELFTEGDEEGPRDGRSPGTGIPEQTKAACR